MTRKQQIASCSSFITKDRIDESGPVRKHTSIASLFCTYLLIALTSMQLPRLSVGGVDAHRSLTNSVLALWSKSCMKHASEYLTGHGCRMARAECVVASFDFARFVSVPVVSNIRGASSPTDVGDGRTVSWTSLRGPFLATVLRPLLSTLHDPSSQSWLRPLQPRLLIADTWEATSVWYNYA